MNAIERIRFAVLLVVLVLAGATGCSMPKAFSLDNAWPWGDDEAKPQLPNRVAGIWTDTVLHKAGEKPQRGFGGRLMFYGADAEKPVIVDGELVVYAFDETGREVTDNKPTRRYVFPADQMALRQSESAVGPSYSFFLPWDEAGGPQTEVSIICRFQPKGGALVISEQTRHLLPGSLRPAGAVAGPTTPKLPEGVPSRPAFPKLSSYLTSPPGGSGAQQASYEVAASAAPNTLPAATTVAATPLPQMTTTSIALPRDFQIPHGVAPAPINAAATPNAQPTVPAANIAVPAAMSGQNASENLQRSPSTTAYQPQGRPISPVAYNPTYASAMNAPGINQPLQIPPLRTIAPPTVATPSAPQQTQVPPQTVAPTNDGQTVVSQQIAPQMMQIPTSGAATVTYR